jgi:tetratricopeptide (TPR) repeat protein
LLSQKQRPQALAELQKLIRKNPRFISGYFALASAYEQGAQYSDAEATLQHALQIDPDNTWAHYRLGIAYLSDKHIPEAKKTFSDRIAQKPKDSDAHYGLGLVLAAEGNHEGAIGEFKTVTQLDKDASGAFYEMGNSYLKLKKYDEAIAVLLNGQKLNGDDEYFESSLADAYLGKGMKAEAAEAQRKAAQLKAQDDDD